MNQTVLLALWFLLGAATALLAFFSAIGGLYHGKIRKSLFGSEFVYRDREPLLFAAGLVFLSVAGTGAVGMLIFAAIQLRQGVS